jgi:hypothetical protein
MRINKAWDYRFATQINLFIAGNCLMGRTGKDDIAVLDCERRILNYLNIAKALAS